MAGKPERKITGKNLVRKKARMAREWKKIQSDAAKGIGRNKKGK